MILAVALLLNNVQRRYPTFWWSPKVAAAQSKPAAGGEMVKAAEGVGEAGGGASENGLLPMHSAATSQRGYGNGSSFNSEGNGAKGEQEVKTGHDAV